MEERQRAIGKHKGYINKSHIEKREDKHIEIKIENIRREAERYRGTKRRRESKQKNNRHREAQKASGPVRI